MELDWYSENDLNNATIFNDDSIISYTNNDNLNKNNENVVDLKNNIKIENCFEQNLNVTNESELLNVLHYLSTVSNALRTLIRSKNIKQYTPREENKPTLNENDENNIQIINQIEYDKILKYLIWIKEASLKIKHLFAIPYRKDNSFDPLNIKPFKTSSYKFCNFKESCSIHKNKNKTCDKNHFVFDMIINDISKLIESINLIGINNLNWILNNKNILVNYSDENKDYSITKLNNNQGNIVENDNYFLIDKTLIFKSFDVSSYVLNKMYEESYSFLNFNNQSLQILI
jgi:hypothetical protein